MKYRDWIASKPFDIGGTTRMALGPLLRQSDPEKLAAVSSGAAVLGPLPWGR